MFALHSIRIKNFRCFTGEHEFNFPDAAGLYFFGGKNLVDAIGSNGSGKSTFLDAIVWCLYGHTARGLRASDTISWGTRDCLVSLKLTVGNNTFCITRTQRPISITLDGKPVDQKDIENHIRLNFDAFMHSILSSQFGSPFLSLTPANKLNLFSEIKNLNFWIEKSDRAAREVAILGNEIDYKKAALDNFKGQLKILKADVDSYTFWCKDLNVKKQHDITRLKNKLCEAEIDLNDMSPLASIKEIKERIKTNDRILDIVLEKLSKHSQEKSYFEGQIKALSIPKETVCPTCHQKIDPNHSYEISSKISELNMNISAVLDDLEYHKKYLIKTKSKIAELRSKLDLLNEEKSLRKELVSYVEDIKAEIKRIESDENPYEKTLQMKITDLKEIRKHIRNIKHNTDNLEADYAAANFWVKGFKQIRLLVIEQAFQTLEIEVNNSLSKLGLPDWQVTFAIDRENKTGGITKGFTTFVKSPKNKEPVKWESWSGGETQRLQLAGNLGLSNLIMQQAGLTNTIEFFDEPSTHLSAEGVLGLANLLYERAITEKKQIWIVDHTAIADFGDFAGVIIARKDKNGSTVSLKKG